MWSAPPAKPCAILHDAIKFSILKFCRPNGNLSTHSQGTVRAKPGHSQGKNRVPVRAQSGHSQGKRHSQGKVRAKSVKAQPGQSQGKVGAKIIKFGARSGPNQLRHSQGTVRARSGQN